jgi:opacity protein-like surface antigen
VSRFRSLIAGIAGLVGGFVSITAAHAADPPGMWVPPAPAVPRYTELLSGWYLRLDGGFSWNHVGSVQSMTPVTHIQYRNAPDVTAGFGYKYQWMRFELTVDRGFPSSFTASTAAAVPQPQYSAKLGSLTFLGSAYVDLGTWWCLTPYIGAGIGLTRLHAKQYVDNGLPPHAVSPQSQLTNVTWAVMAGVAYQVAPNWLIDVGYRRLDLGKVLVTTGQGVFNDSTAIQGVTAQQVRVGLRYLFD